MTSTDTPAGTYPDGSLHLYRYGFTGTERDLLQWLVEHGGAHEPLPAAWPALAVIANETSSMEDVVEEAYEALVSHGLAQPLDDTLERVFELLPVDAVTNLCGCPHTDPAVWPPYGVGQGAPLPPRLTDR